MTTVSLGGYKGPVSLSVVDFIRMSQNGTFKILVDRVDSSGQVWGRDRGEINMGPHVWVVNDAGEITLSNGMAYLPPALVVNNQLMGNDG